MEENIEELTLLLMYLTVWNEKGYVFNESKNMPEEATIKNCFKGYDFGVLNKSTEKGYLYPAR